MPPSEKQAFLSSLHHLHRGQSPVTIMGFGEVFRDKIRPSLEHLGIRDFLIYSPRYQGADKLQRLEDAPAGSVVLILSPNKFHLEQAMSCLNRGLPFYLEKPIAVNQSEIIRFTEALSAQSRSKCYCGDYYFFKALPLLAFFLPGWRSKAEPLLADLPPRDMFGEVVRIEGRLFEGGGKASGTLEHRQWLREVASGGGMLLDLMVHFTNILLLLGYHFDTIESVALYKNDGGKPGCFVSLASDTVCEDKAAVRGVLNAGVPFFLEVSKYAKAQERWLLFYDQAGRALRMNFGAQNTMEIISPNPAETRFECRLEADPYLLTMSEALRFFQNSDAPQALYFEEQAASVVLLEKMKKFYFKGQNNEDV